MKMYSLVQRINIAEQDVELTSPPQTHQKYINRVNNSHRNLLETGRSLILPKLQGKFHVSGQKWEKKRHQNGTGTLGGICEEGKVHTSRLSPGESLCLFRGLLGHIERLEEPGFCLQRVLMLTCLQSAWRETGDSSCHLSAILSLKHVKRGCQYLQGLDIKSWVVDPWERTWYSCVQSPECLRWSKPN